MHDPTPLILKLPPLNPPRRWPLGGNQTAQGLNVGFFIQTDHQFAPVVEPLHVLITPQHFGRQPHELLIQPGRLPITTAVRLQTGLGQDVRHRRVVDRSDDGLLHHDLLQAAAIPPGQMQPVGAGGRAGDVLDRDPLQGGKKPLAVHCGVRQRSLPRPAAGTAATAARGSCASCPSSARSPRSARPDPTPTRLAPAWPSAEGLAHRWQPAPSTGGRLLSSGTLKGTVLSSAAPPLRASTIRGGAPKSNLLNDLRYSPLDGYSGPSPQWFAGKHEVRGKLQRQSFWIPAFAGMTFTTPSLRSCLVGM